MFGFGKITRTITIDEDGNVTDIDDGSIVKREASKHEQAREAFYAHGANIDGDGEPKPYNDNGREYNSASDNWEYTAAANGNANPFHARCVLVSNSDYGSDMATDSGL